MSFCLTGNPGNNFCKIFLLLVLLLWLPSSAKRYKKPWFCDNKLDGDPQQQQQQLSSPPPMSFLWSVRRDPPAYFFGTIHVPYTRVWDFIPDGTKQAFESSDNVFFELDLLDPRTISALASCQMLPKGKTLVDLLPEDMFRRLKVHLDYVKVMMPSWMTADQRGRGLYAEYLFNAITGNWERKRPVWVMLMVNALTESDVKSRGIPVLDLFLAQEAERLNKRTGAVERVEEQCLPLNGLNLSQVLFALNQTLVQHEGLRVSSGVLGGGAGGPGGERGGGAESASYTTDDLIKHYNCGDLNSVVFSQDTTQVYVPALSSGNASGGGGGGRDSALAPADASLAKDIDDYFRSELIYKRNRRMGNRVAQLLRNYPQQSFFFAFGAGHYLGNDTVLDFVQRAGFQVDHLPPHKKIRGSKRSRENRKVGSPSSPSSSEWSWSNGSPLSDLLHGGETPQGEQGSGGAGRAMRGRLLHPAITLLRTTPPPPPPPRAPRKFNDLWVRIDTFSTREPYTSSREAKQQQQQQHHQQQQQRHSEKHHEAKAFENSLRLWYGLSSDAGAIYPSRPLLLVVAAIARLVATSRGTNTGIT